MKSGTIDPRMSTPPTMTGMSFTPLRPEPALALADTPAPETPDAADEPSSR